MALIQHMVFCTIPICCIELLLLIIVFHKIPYNSIMWKWYGIMVLIYMGVLNKNGMEL